MMRYEYSGVIKNKQNCESLLKRNYQYWLNSNEVIYSKQYLLVYMHFQVYCHGLLEYLYILLTQFGGKFLFLFTSRHYIENIFFCISFKFNVSMFYFLYSNFIQFLYFTFYILILQFLYFTFYILVLYRFYILFFIF